MKKERFHLYSLFEKLTLLVGLISFWPYVFGIRTGWYFASLVIIMIALTVVAVMRMRKVKRSFQKLRSSSVFPFTEQSFEPPGHAKR